MKLWSDRFKPHIPFEIARRNHLQTKWDQRQANTKGKRIIGGSIGARSIGFVFDPKSQNRSGMVCR